MISLVRASWLVLKKDWMLEWRTRARLTALLFFAFTTLILFSFAMGPDIKVLRAHAAGYLWLGLLFASILSLGESFRVEAENQSLTGLLLIPVDPRAIYVGKMIGNASLLFGLSLVLLPVTIALFDIDLTQAPLQVLASLALGAVGISAPGTVLSAITSRTRARDVLLPLLLFPLLSALVFSGVNATKHALVADLQSQSNSWLQLQVAFDLIYLSLGFLVFPSVVEED